MQCSAITAASVCPMATEMQKKNKKVTKQARKPLNYVSSKLRPTDRPSDSTLHYAAIESNWELKKSLKVMALLLLTFGPNLKILFLACVKS